MEVGDVAIVAPAVVRAGIVPWIAATRGLRPIFGARALSEIGAIFAATTIVAAIVGAIRSALVNIASAAVAATHVSVIRPALFATRIATPDTAWRAAVAELGAALTAQVANLAAQVGQRIMDIAFADSYQSDGNSSSGEAKDAVITDEEPEEAMPF